MIKIARSFPDFASLNPGYRSTHGAPLRIAAPVPAHIAAHAPRLDLAELAEHAPDEAAQLVVEPHRQPDRLGALEARERERRLADQRLHRRGEQRNLERDVDRALVRKCTP